MADTTEVSEPLPSPAATQDRVVFALRQAALIGAALLVAGLVTERVRPPEILDRGIASVPFLWAIVVWVIVLLLNALAFDRSQMGKLEALPFFAGLAAGGFVFLSGLVGLGEASVGRRAIYAFANSLGAAMFWWGIFSLGYLLVQRLGD